MHVAHHHEDNSSPEGSEFVDATDEEVEDIELMNKKLKL